MILTDRANLLENSVMALRQRLCVLHLVLSPLPQRATFTGATHYLTLNANNRFAKQFVAAVEIVTHFRLLKKVRNSIAVGCGL